MDLVLRKTGLSDPKRAYSLSVRNHDLGGTAYSHVCYMTQDLAYVLADIKLGPYFLYGPPDENKQQRVTFQDIFDQGRELELRTEINVLKGLNALSEIHASQTKARMALLGEKELELQALEVKNATPKE